MRLTLLVLTIDGEEKLAQVLPHLQGIADELVIGIDDRTRDRSEEVARQFTTNIHTVNHEGFRGGGSPDSRNAIEDMLPHCSGDWVLRIDHDETLSPHWKDQSFLDAILGDAHATHYWIPRRWMLPTCEHFIASRHWFPDYQLRLYRNIPSLIQFNRAAHDPPIVAGEARRLTRPWITHWDFAWHDRKYRQAKVDFYKEFSSYTGEDFYLYEDYEFDERVVDYDPSRGQATSENIAPHEHSASIQVLDVPRLYAGEVAHILIEISNASQRVLHPNSMLVYPWNVAMSYHWYRLGDPPVTLDWEGTRQALPGRIHPSQRLEAFLEVKAPADPGTYLLQPDLVEDDVCWYSQRCPASAFPMIQLEVHAVSPQKVILTPPATMSTE